MPSAHNILRDANAPWWELRISVDSSDCYRPHTHDEYSIGLVDSGSAVFQHPSGPADIGAGTVVLIEPHVVHACNTVTPARWSYRMLYIDAAWLHDAIGSQSEFVTHCARDAALWAALDGLLNSPQHLSELLPKVLAGWMRPAVAGAATAKQLAPAEALMRSEGGLHLSVATLAEACGMTPSTFIRQFSKRYGMTPGDYLQDKRVNEARSLIGKGMSISEAAFAMGFADQAHLQRSFKQHHAMTPGRYSQSI